ncbi:hypothetical protein A1O1_05587 [Capronia coronata CBS 617.96]|uniref:Yippee/Mis18/Cereblon domain-containing protein n=1 Tax=Capronia coronata CBS 617.96 TaxID=1182541 RepID=W9YHB4_9EURO|nr:uncharacterized protein A1O1_05587 [Capronia coronata CBS 617.96]EXJ88656.1 hypothetical protein A1O1_05587 [Capronia coronata CBS 617.96]
MASATLRKSQMSPVPAKAPGNVILCCAQCENHLGIYENNWIRVTSSYARPGRPGTLLGIKIGRKTQVVPEGASQRDLQGCTLAQLSCKKCSTVVGQYCKAAATPEQERLVDQYFYRQPRTFLRSNETNDRIEPIVATRDELIHAEHAESSGAARQSLLSTTAVFLPRLSQTPSRSIDTPTQFQPRSETKLRSSYQPSPLRNESNSSRTKDGPLLLEMRLSAQEERLAAQNVRLQQQETQIQLLTSLVDTFRDSLQEMKSTLRELQSQRSMLQTESSKIDVTGDPEGTENAMTEAQPIDAEVERLRAENAAMKAKLDSIASAVGAVPRKPPQSTPAGPMDEPSQNVLGKRKRDGSIARSSASQVSNAQFPASQAADVADTVQTQEPPIASDVSPTEQPERISRKSTQQNKKIRKGPGLSHDEALVGRGERLQTTRRNKGTTNEDQRATNGTKDGLLETPDEMSETSGAALLDLFTQGSRATRVTTREESMQRNGQQESRSRASRSQQGMNSDTPAQAHSQIRVGIVSAKPVGSRLSSGNNVEFSDDDLVNEPYEHNNHGDGTQGDEPKQNLHDLSQIEAFQDSTPALRTQRKTTAAVQSLHAIRETRFDEHVQTSREARMQARGMNKEDLQKASYDQVRPMKTTQVAMDAPIHTSNEREPPDETVEDSSSQPRQEPADTTSLVQDQREPAIGDSAAKGLGGSLSRKQQRAEEIRRRDQLAKEALEMDD